MGSINCSRVLPSQAVWDDMGDSVNYTPIIDAGSSVELQEARFDALKLEYRQSDVIGKG